MVLKGGTLERFLDLKDGILMNAFSALKKGVSGRSMALRTLEVACFEPGREASPEGNHAGNLILDWPASRTASSKFLLFINYSASDVLL